MSNHISEALLVAASKYKNILFRHELCRGRARSLKGMSREGEDPRDFALGGGQDLQYIGISPRGERKARKVGGGGGVGDSGKCV